MRVEHTGSLRLIVCLIRMSSDRYSVRDGFLRYILPRIAVDLQPDGNRIEQEACGMLPWIPNLAWIIGSPLIGPCAIDHTAQVIVWPPIQQEFRLAIVEPG